jgi:GntR family transcriptional regulator / MocR family aminotransferase
MNAGATDFLQLRAALAPPRGMTTWLAGELRAAIADGRLPPGTALPATRALGTDLGISRGVVVEAYQRLRDEALISGRPGAGTRVAPLAGTPPAPGRPAGAGVTPAGRPSATAVPSGVPPPGVPASGWPPVDGRPDFGQLPLRWRSRSGIDMSPGVPDLSAFPRAAWLRAERAVLARASAADLGYGDPRGSDRLRTELAGWLARTRGLRAAPDDIIVVNGVAQALALLARVLVSRGTDRVAVEDPGSSGATGELAYWGLTTVPVAVDEHGLRADRLAASGAGVALVTPAHQFPTGVVLAPHRRGELLAWAAAGGLVIEDDYDAEYRYDRAPVPALHASAPDRIAYAGSTSKALAPGMRLGWLIPPPGLRPDLIAAKHASDLGSPALPQMVLAQMIANGELERHIRLVRGRQRHRRDALLAALREHLPQARVQGVAAGLHLLVTFPSLTGLAGDTDLASEIHRAGVLVHPLSWHRHEPGPPGLVLGYAAHAPDQLRDAARRIAAIVRRAGRAPGCPLAQVSGVPR